VEAEVVLEDFSKVRQARLYVPFGTRTLEQAPQTERASQRGNVACIFVAYNIQWCPIFIHTVRSMIQIKTIEVYVTENGKAPFLDWLRSLQDKTTRGRIRNRIRRLVNGMSGDCEPVGEGVFELRLFFGSGYRIYFSEYGGSVILLLCGGDKKTQSRDIQKAKDYWKEFKETRK
jgi:putative addiction module killer protein